MKGVQFVVDSEGEKTAVVIDLKRHRDLEGEGFEAMEVMLKYGADARAADSRGQSALDIARAREEDEKIELLKEYDVG